MNESDFLATFLDEAGEILEMFESSCLAIEKNPTPESLDALFRSAHNLKGSSKSVGLIEFGGFVHKVEDLITKLKSGSLQVNSSIIGCILDCQQLLLQWVQQLREDASAKLDTTQYVSRLAAFDQPKSATIDESPAFGFFDDPPVSPSPKESIPKTPTDLGSILIASGAVSQEQIENAVSLQNRKLGEVLVDAGVVSPAVVGAALEQQKQVGHKADETVRVSTKKLDMVIRLIGELTIQHSILNNAKDQDKLNQSHSIEALNLSHKIVQDLQGEAMSLRMQPLDGFFQRMERVAKDVARQQGKHIQVILKGTEVELDKTVIERMKDPMVHILRNAVDHGIEDAESRKASGKAEVATVVIEGIQTAANVSIRIIDDGRGLNEEKILKKARDKGLISPMAKPTRQEIHQMIFLPGFSTAEKVTDVSGRGVGMDVVKRSVDDLSGVIGIESEQGKGTKFQINLPSTISILDAVVVGLSGTRYAIPVQDIDEVVDMSSATIETTTQKGRVLNLRGRILPVENLSNFLPSQDSGEPRTRPGVALITRSSTQAYAFEVDAVEGQQSIAVRQLESNLSKVPGFVGGTILSNGEPSMIVHLPQVVKAYLSSLEK